ncbi:hypothetical protein QE152_g15590 [Popillia japonica]|uniref:Uncharacterized protein n=1 Tax=Popillia japonica TaxID=7064 RepID=A0AAW1L545_POPJA
MDVFAGGGLWEDAKTPRSRVFIVYVKEEENTLSSDVEDAEKVHFSQGGFKAGKSTTSVLLEIEGKTFTIKKM